MRMRFTILPTLLCLVVALTSVRCSKPEEAEVARPNIVLIVADDLGWRDVSFHGAEFPTPHIDRIASEGVELDRFYATPICTPTRVALLTGRYPIRYGLQRVTIKPWTDLGIPPETETLGESLARAGYTRRGAFGKWHLGESKTFHPLAQGFTEFVGHYGGAIDYFQHTRIGALDWHHGVKVVREEGYSTELIGEHAVRFIQESVSAEPFFLYVPFNAIHTPDQATEEYLQAHAKIEPENRRVKAAMTTCMDDQIGRILATLDEVGLAENTFVLFFSDNGGVPNRGSDNAPLRGRKHTLYEGGIRVAAAARWPSGGLSDGRKVSAPISVLDLYPTLAAIAGVEPDDGAALDGENVLPILRGEVEARDGFRYHGYFNGQTIAGNGAVTDAERRERNSLIEGPWKLVREGPNLDLQADPKVDATLELFRIVEDPYEQSNVIESEPEVAADLIAKMMRFRSLKPSDAMPMPLSQPKGFKVPEDWRLEE